MKVIDEATVFEINLDSTPVKIDIDEHRYYIQLDDFYANPHMVEELAHSIPLSQSVAMCNGMPKNAHSGRANANYDLSHFGSVFAGIIHAYYPGLRTTDAIQHSLSTVSFMCQAVCSQDLPAIGPHIDYPEPGRFAATIGLTPTPHCRGGTSFYTQLDTQESDHYVTDTTDSWRMDALAELAWNRLIMYPTNYWHTAYVKPGWYDTSEQLRVTQQFFI